LRGVTILKVKKNAKLVHLVTFVEHCISLLLQISINRIFHPQYVVNRLTVSNVMIALTSFAMNSKILDVGSGAAPYWKNRQDCNWIGLDVYPAHSETIVVTPGLPWNLPSSSFDGVLCTQVLEHSFDFNLVLSEINRTLKQNGILVISVPFLYPYHGAPEDYHRFTKFAMTEHLKDYEIVDFVQLGNYFQTQAMLKNIFLEEKLKSRASLRLIRILTFPALIVMFTLNNLKALCLSKADKNSIFPIGLIFVCRKITNSPMDGAT
jgi:SAM-dependent methyltransferase